MEETTPTGAVVGTDDVPTPSSEDVTLTGSTVRGAIFNFTNTIVGAGAIGLGGAMVCDCEPQPRRVTNTFYFKTQFGYSHSHFVGEKWRVGLHPGHSFRRLLDQAVVRFGCSTVGRNTGCRRLIRRFSPCEFRMAGMGHCQLVQIFIFLWVSRGLPCRYER